MFVKEFVSLEVRNIEVYKKNIRKSRNRNFELLVILAFLGD